jgi:hypothetical protein
MEFRRAGHRTFYRVEGENVMRVVNMEKQSEVLAGENWLIAEDVLSDTQTCKVITEQEFTDQLNIAMERIKNMSVL